MKIEGKFYDRTTTPECSEDRPTVRSVVKMKKLSIFDHDVKKVV